MVRRWSYLVKYYDFKLKPKTFNAYGYKSFKKITKFKKYSLGKTKIIRLKNNKIKRKTILLVLLRILYYWVYFYLKLFKLYRYYQSKNLFLYNFFFQNQFLTDYYFTTEHNITNYFSYSFNFKYKKWAINKNLKASIFYKNKLLTPLINSQQIFITFPNILKFQNLNIFYNLNILKNNYIYILPHQQNLISNQNYLEFKKKYILRNILHLIKLMRSILVKKINFLIL